jgi:hypothetical protein
MSVMLFFQLGNLMRGVKSQYNVGVVVFPAGQFNERCGKPKLEGWLVDT